MVSRVEKALVGMPDPRAAGLLAQDLQRVEVVPTLAFTPSQIFTCLDAEAWDLLILHADLGGGDPLRLLGLLQDRTEAATVLIGSKVPFVVLVKLGVHQQFAEETAYAEVASRSAALLKLRRPAVARDHLHWGQVNVDLARRVAHLNLRCLKLTPLQFRMLAAFVAAEGAVLTTRDLSRAVWGTSMFGTSDRVVTQIRRLRQRIEANPAEPRVLLTVRGEGYRLADQ